MIVISEKTLEAFREEGLCEWCDVYCYRREPHHVISRGHGGGTRLDIKENLVGLCWRCHSLYGDDPDCASEFFEIIAVREGFAHWMKVRNYLWLVLRTPKEEPMPVAPACPF